MQVEACPRRLAENGSEWLSVSLVNKDIEKSEVIATLGLARESNVDMERIQSLEKRLNVIRRCEDREGIIDEAEIMHRTEVMTFKDKRLKV